MCSYISFKESVMLLRYGTAVYFGTYYSIISLIACVAVSFLIVFYDTGVAL
uniref:Uncharacterized protein n=1 Tax=Arundo donax TaxID=35708 RepID=A0A0A9ESK7_ARUDO